MELNIAYWNDITSHLNGYSLADVSISGDALMGVNAQGKATVLAKRTKVFWTPVDGPAYEAMSVILREINDNLKADGIYEPQAKDKAVMESLKKIITLQPKQYRNKY